MNPPCILPLEACLDRSLAGAKAAGLATLLQAGWPVPAGVCLTTAAYELFLHHAGLDSRRWDAVQGLPSTQRAAVLESVRRRLIASQWPPGLLADLMAELRRLSTTSGGHWAVRSSSTHEDLGDASFAGQYRTELGVTTENVPQGVLNCWASLWDARIAWYLLEQGSRQEPPVMAVVVQRMLWARTSGVAFSRHPVTGNTTHVVINAVPGLGEPFVAGRVSPDEYEVEIDDRPEIIRRNVARKQTALRMTAQGLVTEMLNTTLADMPAMTDAEAKDLAGSVKRLESESRRPVDVEWAIEEGHIWFVQVRPMTALDGREGLTNERCDWSRANFKETFPDRPSPLGLSFLKDFMDEFIMRHYRELGCVIPPRVSTVRIVEGRPYINVTLLQSCASQLGGRPEYVTEQMGGDGYVPSWLPPALPMWKRLKAAALMHRSIRQATARAPSWFAALRQSARHEMQGISAEPTITGLLERMDRLSRYLASGELTFAIVAAVAQALQVFGTLLPGWLGKDWRSLLNETLQGQTGIISAKQIRDLTDVGNQARQEEKAAGFFLDTAWNPSAYRERLSGTVFLKAFDAFLEEYGHRAVGESDMMTPRFVEDPTYLLEIIRAQVRQSPPDEEMEQGPAQEDKRIRALTEIRRRCGWKVHRWMIFRWWHRRLCRASALREANRHALMSYAAVTRAVLLEIGGRLAEAGRMTSREDVFFLTSEELKGLDGETCDWKPLVQARRSDHSGCASMTPPDFIPMKGRLSPGAPRNVDGEGRVPGVAISGGTAEGPARLILQVDDIGKVRRGDILVTSVIDPGMATVFSLAGGIVAEMGGTLSHGAIIAREYGIPALVNVPEATRLFKDGDRIRLDCAEGVVGKVRA